MEIPLGIFEEITGMGKLPPPVDEADYERRKHQRAPFGFRGAISYDRRNGEHVSNVVMVRDISCGGLSFINEDTLKPGTPFIVEFKGHDDRPVQIRCSVIRCSTGGLEETEHIIGATFETLLTEEMKIEATKEEPKPAEATKPDAKIEEVDEDAAAEMIDGDDVTEEPAPVNPAPVIPVAATPAQPKPAEAAPAPAAPAPAVAAAAPAKTGSSLFLSSAAGPKQKRTSDEFPSEDEVSRPAPKPAPAQDAGPVFRDVPLPPDPTPAPTQQESSSESSSSDESSSPDESSSHDSPSTHDFSHITTGGGKTQEVLARVKELLVKQEQTIKKQQQQLREQRDHASKEVQSLRVEVQAMKKHMADLQARTQADDQAISDLASFLEQHSAVEPGRSSKPKSEAA